MAASHSGFDNSRLATGSAGKLLLRYYASSDIAIKESLVLTNSDTKERDTVTAQLFDYHSAPGNGRSFLCSM